MTAKPTYVAARGLCYTPSGAKEEVRVEAGEPVTGMPREVLKTCIDNGKVVAATSEGEQE